jgi:two-component system, OmpR family, KDP operon response regulator KdpE
MAKVLVVDDDPALRQALRGALGRVGFDVVVAPDARGGIDLLSTAGPDVVVLDLGLPDAHGLDVVRRFRSLSSVPVLILSGSTDESRKVQALEAGADDYLDKPFGIDELGARLRALLRRSGAGASEAAPARPVRHELGRLVLDLGARTVATYAGWSAGSCSFARSERTWVRSAARDSSPRPSSHTRDSSQPWVSSRPG